MAEQITTPVPSTPDVVDRTLRAATDEQLFSRKVLDGGFKAALIFTAVLLAASVIYLFLFMYRVSAAPDSSAFTTAGPPTGDLTKDAFYMARHETQVRLQYQARSEASNLVFSSIGLLVGVAMAFIGVALFLMGIRGDMDASGKGKEMSFRLARLSPGMLAILCATIIVLWCINSRPTPIAPTVTTVPNIAPGFGFAPQPAFGFGLSGHAAAQQPLMSSQLIDLATRQSQSSTADVIAVIKKIRDEVDALRGRDSADVAERLTKFADRLTVVEKSLMHLSSRLDKIEPPATKPKE